MNDATLVTLGDGVTQQSVVDVMPFIGRDEQIEAFLNAIAEAECHAFIIKGDSGVGKTRLANECLNRARAMGYRGGRSAVPAPNGFPLATLAHLLPADLDRLNPVEYFRQACESINPPSIEKRPRKRFILLVDELQFIDTASATLISQLLDAGIVFLLATSRWGTRMSDVTSTLERADSSHCVEIEEFTLAETERILDAALGGLVTPRTSAALQHLSRGNASHLRELTIGSLASRNLVNDGEVWHLQGSLRSTRRLHDIFHTNLERVGEGARELLELISLCQSVGARDFSIESTCQLESSGFVESVRQGAREILTITDPLYREILLCDIPESRKRKLLTEHIARLRAHGARRRQDTISIALWELETKGSVEPSLLLRGALSARLEREYSATRTLAAEAFRNISEFWPCLLLGEALHEVGEFREAERVLEIAEELAGSDDQRVLLTLIRTCNLTWGLGNSVGALDANSKASNLIQSPDAGSVLANNEAMILISLGKRTSELTSLASPTPASNAVSEMLEKLTRVWLLAIDGRASDALNLGQNAYRQRMDIGETECLGLPDSTHFLIPVIFATGEVGRLQEAHALGLQEWEKMHKNGLHCSNILLSLIIARCAVMQGLPRTARRWAGQAAGMARQSDSQGPLYAAVHLIAEAAMMSGDEQAAKRALAEADSLPAWGVFVSERAIGQARYAANRGDRPLARELLMAAAADARATGNLVSEVRILTEAARLGDITIAAERLAELARSSDGEITSACANYFSARVDGTPADLFSSSHRLERSGALLLAAEAAAAGASAWRRRNSTRRATAADNRAARLAGMCEGVVTADLVTTPASVQLTTREREIAILIAQRLTNTEIADRAKISRRTVENHLQNIYRKLGVSSRSELRNAFKGTA
ncbi:LuxR C-terminal-related transcriptional regulator [Streptomyces sp. NPDC060064]|uniref:helix-turn-helix transcriptional regulator n=1 Tax=Streptomyces sp. NPDC060064 TaxID=3347049 RepID=UPI00367780B4